MSDTSRGRVQKSSQILDVRQIAVTLLQIGLNSLSCLN